ncbi:protein of unknown function (DUF1835) [Desulfosporosinus acidiphilus SJ4]|uniref:DUF1835 domain-containing protein n=1 Tax=Desulfosporosinus acidiphilus (strain DSM 22704 / JCM 16185 / SJ4) TaxID=646529 RepID=I4D0E7_DESAJ|nr:DUF3658 domain-containing protein [Desulfosporosinus acidiphilus]AFM39271.1 protein of unknown function (DUF1835) [Desulfosporosinus acidiphilus SJ4]
MIEIVFSDSACGSLKVAQHYGEGEYRDGGIGVIVSHEDGSKPTKEEVEAARRKAKEKARLAWESATPLGGNTADIYGFNLMLSVGDISENQPGIKRQQTLEHLYSVYPNDVGYQAAQKMFKRVKEDLKTVQERAAMGESLRIWYSNHPDEMCGLYWFMGQLIHWKVHVKQVSIVKLPEWEADEKGNIVQKRGWGEVAPGEWHRYIALQKPVLPIFVQSCASHWQGLQRENTPLRATLNGQLVSAPEPLYDDFIYREIEAEGEEFREVKVIGRVMSKYQLGISDSWIALRMEEMIREGKLEVTSVVAEDMPVYHRVLKKCTYRL